jgi:hypothetical protein
MPASANTWNPEAVRALYTRGVKACEEFFGGRNRPETSSGQAFFDLCLAEYEVGRHLLTVDCFSSREALLKELRRLLSEPVTPSSQLPCRADQYLESQKRDIEFQIRNLTLE